MKENIFLRSKEIDKYLMDLKNNLKAKKELEENVRFHKKNLKAVNDRIRKLNDWYREL